MENRKKLKNVIMSQMLIIISTIIILGTYIYYSNVNTDMTSNSQLWIVNMVAFFVITLLGIYFTFNELEIFDPLLVISGIYLLIFYFAPLVWIFRGENSYYGVNVMTGTLKGSLYFCLGYFFLWLGYITSTHNYKTKVTNTSESSNGFETIPKTIKKGIIKNMFFLYMIFSMLGVIYFFSMGKNLAFIFSLGQKANEGLGESSYQFLTNFITGLIPVLMVLYAYMDKHRWILLPMVSFTGLLMIVAGSRYRIFILILAPIIFKYLKNNKRPKVKNIIILAILLIIVNGIVAIQRESVRNGLNLVSNYSFNEMLNQIMPNINVFFPFYKVVETFPEMHNYYYFKGTIFYTVFYSIPRFIWPNKPFPPIWETITISLNSYARNAGVAYPNIGEYYVDFGVIGIIIGMFMFGILAGHIKKLSISKNRISMISFSIALPSLLQLVSRGYMPQNFFMVLFLIIPLVVARKIEKNNTNSYSRKRSGLNE